MKEPTWRQKKISSINKELENKTNQINSAISTVKEYGINSLDEIDSIFSKPFITPKKSSILRYPNNNDIQIKFFTYYFDQYYDGKLFKKKALHSLLYFLKIPDVGFEPKYVIIKGRMICKYDNKYMNITRGVIRNNKLGVYDIETYRTNSIEDLVRCFEFKEYERTGNISYSEQNHADYTFDLSTLNVPNLSLDGYVFLRAVFDGDYPSRHYTYVVNNNVKVSSVFDNLYISSSKYEDGIKFPYVNGTLNDLSSKFMKLNNRIKEKPITIESIVVFG